jgi:hypothetical protein
VRALIDHYSADRAVAERILAARVDGEMSEEDLAAALARAARETPLAHYLGVRTWFWRIAVTGPSRRLEWIVARLPARAGTAREDEARLQVVEETWSAR